MDIELPKCLDFSKLSVKCECDKPLVKNVDADCPFKDCECGRTNFYLRKWEISVPAEDSMIWAIVVSYLVSTNLSDDDSFRKKLELLTGIEQHPNFSDIKKCISRFNPFQNRHSCFYNKNLQEVVLAFKNKLNENSRRNLDVHEQLTCASQLLKCSILLLKSSENEETPYLLSFHQEDSIYSVALFSYRESIITNPQQRLQYRFSYGLKKDKGLKMKRDAFANILKQAKIHREMKKKLIALAETSENFLISLLYSECLSIIPQLYKTPYLMFKLAEAGFETDPRAVDKQGQSALYHALSTVNESQDKLLFILYDYAANDCYNSVNSFRNPDDSILSNLQRLGEMFDSFKAEEENKIFLSYLVRLNSFLSEIAKKVFEICGDTHYNTICPPKKGEAEKIKDAMLAVLEKYNTFFWFSDFGSIEEKSLLDDFIRHSNYYENLDYLAAQFFFDNIFHLKERLSLEGCSKLESSFFFSILVTKYFVSGTHRLNYFYGKGDPQQANVSNCKYLFSDPNRKYLLIIPFLERFDLQRKICNFIEHLRPPVEDNFLENLPESEIPLVLSDFSEIKDEFLIRKLIYYVETALNTEVKSLKSVLVIEMALQVIGETIVFGKANPSSLCRLLWVCLNSDTERKIKHVRNALSHPEKYGFALKFQAERELKLFRKIQSEIKSIYEIFQVVFEIQQLRVVNFVIERGLERVKHYEKDGRSGSHKPFILPNHLVMAELEINNEHKRIQEIEASLRCENKFLKNPVLLENLLRTTEEETNNESIWKCDLEIAVEKVKEVVWCLKYLMTFLFKDYSFSNSDMKSKFDQINTETFNSLTIDDLKIKLAGFISNTKAIVAEILSEDRKGVKKTQLGTANAIGKLERILKGNAFLAEEEKEDILNKIPQEVQDAVFLKERMQEKIANGISLTTKDCCEIDKLSAIFSNKRVDKLNKACRNDSVKALKILKSASSPIKDLNDILEADSVTMKLDDFKMLCEKMQFSNEIRETLSKLYTGLKTKTLNERNFTILLTRINQLKEILIEERSEISELWSKAINPKTVQYAKHKIVLRYIRDCEVQASVEMLLFDCMNILRNQGKLGNLWIKRSNLYSGINLRNVLSHGNPALQGIGKLLDPEDLPSGLVNEMLQLVEDEHILQAMQELCSTTRTEYFGRFHEIMNDDNDTTYQALRAKILGCCRWKSYSAILPKEITPETTLNLSTETEEH